MNEMVSRVEGVLPPDPLHLTIMGGLMQLVTATGAARFTDAQLWRCLDGCLATLASGLEQNMTLQRRQLVAWTAQNCARELRMRGTQLRLVD